MGRESLFANQRPNTGRVLPSQIKDRTWAANCYSQMKDRTRVAYCHRKSRTEHGSSPKKEEETLK